MLAGGAVTATAMTAAEQPSAPTAKSSIDPGFVISDEQFYDSDALTVDEIQDVLDTHGGSCTSALCVRKVAVDTQSQTPDSICPTGYAGGEDQGVAQIIHDVSAACGISAKVLLVVLQKEQSLVHASGTPSQERLDWALGYGCYDDAEGCREIYRGIGTQIFWAAWSLNAYRVRADYYTYAPGVHEIRYAPADSEGQYQCFDDDDRHAAPVAIRNWATAALYNYTPYLYDVNVSCSSKDKRNFTTVYRDWFGSPTS